MGKQDAQDVNRGVTILNHVLYLIQLRCDRIPRCVGHCGMLCIAILDLLIAGRLLLVPELPAAL